MSWFDEVTGSNEYERQSWRDSFNGGKAAGDWTGNHNQRIQEERDNFQGTTWSGSSTQPSALQLAQSLVGTGPALGSVAVGTGSSGTGPASGVVSTAPQVVAQGPGNGVVANGPSVPTGGPGLRIVVNRDMPTWYDVRNPNDYRYTPIGFGLTWASPADFAMGEDLESEMGEGGSFPFQAAKFTLELGHNAVRVWDWTARNAPALNGALGSDVFEPQPVYHDGWVSYDERQTWERAPSGSPTGFWSF